MSRPITTIILLCCLASLSPAWDGAAVLEATADLRWEEYADSSPSPVGWVYWQESGTNGVDVMASYGDGADDMYNAAWFACCTNDSMVFRGGWPEIDPDNDLWNMVYYDVTLYLRMYAEEGVRIVASRGFNGTLSQDDHAVTVTDTADLEVELLSSDTSDEGELELPPGSVFMVTLRIDALENGTHYAYDGAVEVRFEDPDYVAVQNLTLGAVKNLFR